jgi:hypothetical protein
VKIIVAVGYDCGNISYIKTNKGDKVKLYRYEKINNEIQETYIMSFTSERDAFDKMIEMQYHLVNTGYSVKSVDLDHLIVEKTLTTGATVWKRFELE